MNDSRILVIIPCFNEQESIGSVLNSLKKIDVNVSPLVINDGSTDNTEQRAREAGADVVSHVLNLGIGGAVQTGIKWAQKHGYQRCVQIDGDGQHPPEQLVRLLQVMDEEKCDMVIGSRYLTKAGFQSSSIRRAGIGWLGFVLAVFFGKKISDPTSGFRLLGPRIIDLFSRKYPHDFPEPISIAQALTSDMSIVETQVEMQARLFGVSSIGWIKSLSYMIRVTSYILLTKIAQLLKVSA